jgi:hypothetical protein
MTGSLRARPATRVALTALLALVTMACGNADPKEQPQAASRVESRYPFVAASELRPQLPLPLTAGPEEELRRARCRHRERLVVRVVGGLRGVRSLRDCSEALPDRSLLLPINLGWEFRNAAGRLIVRPT